MEAQSSVLQQMRERIDFDAMTTSAAERIMEEYFRRLRQSTITTDEVTERITEIFDTTQRADSTSGTPPLLIRTTERTEMRQKSENREKTEIVAAERENKNLADAARLSVNAAAASMAKSRIENEIKSEEEKHSGNIAGWICISFSFLVMAAVAVAVFIKPRLNNH